NKCHCCCGFTFFTLIILNVLMWLGWASLGQVIASDVVLQGASTEDDLVLDAVRWKNSNARSPAPPVSMEQPIETSRKFATAKRGIRSRCLILRLGLASACSFD
ncbi:unnamed protein product, partial [Ectocarpus sp. 12 AP-2014]